MANRPVVLRGPTYNDPDAGRTVGNLYGFVQASVAKVRLMYPDGSSDVASATTGGFIVPIDVARHPTELVALDSSGEEVTSIDLSRLVAGELAAAAATREMDR